MTQTTASAVHLDDDQRLVVAHERGSLRALGGPGTGKTTVLVERFVACALAPGSAPDRVLFLVPNRAQKIALRDRLTRRLLLEEGLDALVEVPVYTWHGFAYHLVSRHYDSLGYPEPPVLLTSPEQWGDVRDALAAEPEANWPHFKHLLRNRAFVDEVVDFSIRAKQRELVGDELERLAQARPEWAEIVRFFRAHQARVQARARIDYPTLLADALWLVSNRDDIRAALHERFRHVVVDDAQELSLVQQHLLRFLGPTGDDDRSLVVAGDPDSAIETFRGADPEWLGRFDALLGRHDSVTLRTSYRLGPDVGARAATFVGGPQHEPGERAFAGDAALEVRRLPSLAAEADAVARELRRAHLQDGVPFDDMAILLTSPRALLPALERALQAVEVPYSIAAPDRPLESEPAVRAFCDLARVAFDGDARERVDELLRSPFAGLTDAEVRDLERRCRLAGVALAEALGRDGPSELLGDVPDGVRAKLESLARLRGMLEAAQARPADEAFWVVWEAAPYYRALVDAARADASSPAHRDLDALVAFARALGRFVERRRGTGTLADYLDAIGRADFGSDPWLPPERAAGGVEVCSFHAAKGREWAVVAVCGCTEGAIPKGRRARGLFDPYFLDETSPVERARKNDAEDRRVFYVAITRARTRCLVTTSPGVTRKAQPSRFIEALVGEVPPVETATSRAPLTFAEAATRLRGVLGDAGAPPPERVAALGAIARVCELDPGCSAAQPVEWWWRWDWTEGRVPVRRHGAEDDLPPDKLRTSYSRISQYDDCGLKYLFSVVLGLDPESSHNMAFGTWMHKVFEECETGVLTNLDAARARYDELFDESVFPNRVVARQFRRDGELMLERYVRHLRPGRAALAEKRFEVDFGGHVLTGRIDRVDRIGKGLVVSDYKTSRYAISWDEARASLQLAIYYLAARSDPEISALGEPISMQLVYPGKVARGDVVKRCQTPEEAEEALARLPDLVEGVLSEDFRPNPEADCTWCRFKPLCPLWSEGKELPS
ncbi:MAG TPA: ATP-dependent DNA helicase [Actinomycetota bacterium]|nr:ATP-dependent DNA helicase [Actinomycetota bacterium]